MTDETKEAMDVLFELFDCEHICLGDKVYDVRDSELKGWEGPAVTRYGNAATAANALLRKYGYKTRWMQP